MKKLFNKILNFLGIYIEDDMNTENVGVLCRSYFPDCSILYLTNGNWIMRTENEYESSIFVFKSEHEWKIKTISYETGERILTTVHTFAEITEALNNFKSLK